MFQGIAIMFVVSIGMLLLLFRCVSGRGIMCYDLLQFFGISPPGTPLVIVP